jgi:hypothetical protein
MPHSEAQAWWADVQHVRESIERRRARGLDASAPLDTATEARFSRRAEESLPPLDDLEWSSGGWGESTGRFDRAPRQQRSAEQRSAEQRGGQRSAEQRGGQRSAEQRGGQRRSEPRTGQQRGDHAAPPTRRRTERRGGDAVERIDVSAEAAALAAPTLAPAGATGPAVAAALSPAPSRRTVMITGRGVTPPPLPRLVEVERRRPARRTVERIGPRPDRIALWAVLLGFFLILVAATSSNAAVHGAPASHGAAVALHAPAR